MRSGLAAAVLVALGACDFPAPSSMTTPTADAFQFVDARPDALPLPFDAGPPPDAEPALIHGEPYIWKLALDAENIYWVSVPPCPSDGCYTPHPAVFKAPKTGGEPIPLARSVRGTEAIAVDEKYVYYIDNRTYFETPALMQVSKNGGYPVVLSEDVLEPEVVVDSSWVYWVADFKIVAADKNGDNVRDIVTLTRRVRNLSQDDLHLYWLEVNTYHEFDGAVVRVDKSGLNAPVQLVRGVQPWDHLTVAGGKVFWTTGISSSDTAIIEEVDAEGGPSTIIGDHLNAPWDLVADGTTLYFSDSYRLGRIPVGGGEIVYIDGVSHPQALAIDAENVYWSRDTLIDVVPK